MRNMKLSQLPIKETVLPEDSIPVFDVTGGATTKISFESIRKAILDDVAVAVIKCSAGSGERGGRSVDGAERQ